MEPSERQWQNAQDAAESTRHVIKNFPTLLNARALDRLNKEEGYEFPFSGDELSKIKNESKK